MENTNNNTVGFIKLLRTKDVFELIRRRPSAFNLLTLIAYRAKRTNEENFDQLEIGQAYIGDPESYGVTQQVYRTDKKFLENHNLATFKATNKGTIARLISTSIFDINEEKITNKPTSDERTTNERLTTNKNDNNEKKDIYPFKIKKLTSKDAGLPCTDDELKEISVEMNVPLDYIQLKHQQILEQIKSGDLKSNSKTYFTLRKFLSYDLLKGQIKHLPPPPPPPTKRELTEELYKWISFWGVSIRRLEKILKIPPTESEKEGLGKTSYEARIKDWTEEKKEAESKLINAQEELKKLQEKK